MTRLAPATGALAIAPGFELPLDAVTQTFAILAKRGVGKTYTASVLVEEMLKAGLPVVVVDPIGVWWGLRSSADGLSPGLPIVVIGGEEYGDIPLDVAAGATIADLVVDERLSCVLNFQHLRKGEQIRFMTDFAERLYHRNREPLHLVLDEADAYAPQKPMKGAERLLGAIEDLVRRGRARGLGVTLITQRSAVINKDVLTQVEVLIALRTIAPQDRAAIDEWIKVHGTPEQRAELMSSLPTLEIGEAWIWSPAWLDVFRRVHIRTRETFDSSSTPKVGTMRLVPRTLADVDLARLRERLATSIERAKADDPKLLRARVAELEGALAKASQMQASKLREDEPERIVERVDVPVITPGQIDDLRAWAASITELWTFLDRLRDAAAKLDPIRDELRALVDRYDEQQRHPSGRARSGPPTPLRFEPPTEEIKEPLTMVSRGSEVIKTSLDERPRPLAANGAEPAADRPITPTERAILNVLAQFPAGRTRRQLAVLQPYSTTSGSWSSALAAGRAAGRLEGSATDASPLRITARGLAEVGPVVPLPRGRALLDYWLARLGASTWSGIILAAAVDLYPNAVTRDDLAARTPMSQSSGSYSSALGKLRALDLIDRGPIVASAAFFET